MQKTNTVVCLTAPVPVNLYKCVFFEEGKAKRGVTSNEERAKPEITPTQHQHELSFSQLLLPAAGKSSKREPCQSK